MPGWLLRFKSLLFETRPTVNTERVPRLPLKVWLPPTPAPPPRGRPADGGRLCPCRGRARFPRGLPPPPGHPRAALTHAGPARGSWERPRARSTEQPRALAAPPGPRCVRPPQPGARRCLRPPDAASRARGSGRGRPPGRRAPANQRPLREGVTGKRAEALRRERRSARTPRPGARARQAGRRRRLPCRGHGLSPDRGPHAPGGRREGAARARGGRGGTATRSAARLCAPHPRASSPDTQRPGSPGTAWRAARREAAESTGMSPPQGRRAARRRGGLEAGAAGRRGGQRGGGPSGRRLPSPPGAPPTESGQGQMEATHLSVFCPDFREVAFRGQFH